MKYTEKQHGRFLVIYLDGEVDLSCSPKVREQILKALKNHQHLLIELSAVEYIDSSGVACLVEAYQQARSQQIEFALVGVSKEAMQVLQLARLDKIFVIHESLSDCE